jgi:hypothetical protein
VRVEDSNRFSFSCERSYQADQVMIFVMALEWKNSGHNLFAGSASGALARVELANTVFSK